MNAIICDWRGDIGVGPTGDIGLAPADVEVRQRIVRRLLTNPGDYIWHLSYGAGLGAYIGQPYSPRSIENAVLTQMQLEQLVATVPSPTVQITQSLAGSDTALSVAIQYRNVNALTGDSVVVPVGA